MDVSILTLVRGRHGHLVNLVEGLRRSHAPPAELVVAAMGPGEAEAVAALLEEARAEAAFPIRVVPVGAREVLPYSAARNAAAEAADAEGLVFLDVDCIPSRALVGSFEGAFGAFEGLLTGAALYLPPGVPEEAGAWDEAALRRVARRHPARPEPPPAGHTRTDRYEMLWGQYIALRRATFERLGGFDERYDGYAGEDTDLAFTARARGVPMALLGQAAVFHQYHDAFRPPVQHLEGLARNARRFHAKWGAWPMEGWLDAFREMGLVEWAPSGDALTILRAPTEAERAAARRNGFPPVKEEEGAAA